MLGRMGLARWPWGSANWTLPPPLVMQVPCGSDTMLAVQPLKDMQGSWATSWEGRDTLQWDFQEFFWRFLPCVFHTWCEAGSMGAPLLSFSQTRQGSVCSLWDILSHIVPCFRVDFRNPMVSSSRPWLSVFPPKPLWISEQCNDNKQQPVSQDVALANLKHFTFGLLYLLSIYQQCDWLPWIKEHPWEQSQDEWNLPERATGMKKMCAEISKTFQRILDTKVGQTFWKRVLWIIHHNTRAHKCCSIWHWGQKELFLVSEAYKIHTGCSWLNNKGMAGVPYKNLAWSDLVCESAASSATLVAWPVPSRWVPHPARVLLKLDQMHQNGMFGKRMLVKCQEKQT